ncbi:MAG: autoinducer 2 import system permease LsrD [Bacillota bacterium]|jgi:AI-2 transport system permease protein|nr:autoinducer 2 import system permease LsrD [Bacillota bacterium]
MKIFRSWITALFILIAVEFAIFGSISPYFLNLDNLLYSVGDFLYIAVAALPMTLVIVTGGIDISIGSTMGLASITTALLWYLGMNVWLASIFGLLSGAAVGLLNGLLLIITEINPLVITLGSSFLVAGIALILSGLAGATGFEGISGLPYAFSNVVNGTILGIPNAVWILAAVAILFYVILHHTKFGQQLFLIGVNRHAAAYSGIDVDRKLVLTYVIMGMGAALSGILLTSYFTSARSDLGSDSALSVITCVVLGGASINGGSGSIFGTLLASLLIGYLKYGLQMIRVSAQATNVYMGLVLIATISGRYFWELYSARLKNRAATAVQKTS